MLLDTALARELLRSSPVFDGMEAERWFCLNTPAGPAAKEPEMNAALAKIQESYRVRSDKTLPAAVRGAGGRSVPHFHYRTQHYADIEAYR